MLSLWEAGAARVSGLSLMLDASWRWEPSVLSDTGCQLALGARRPVPSKLWHSPPPECPIASTGQDRLTPGSSHLLECPIASPQPGQTHPWVFPPPRVSDRLSPGQDRLARGSSHLPECPIASPSARTDSPLGLHCPLCGCLGPCPCRGAVAPVSCKSRSCRSCWALRCSGCVQPERG